MPLRALSVLLTIAIAVLPISPVLAAGLAAQPSSNGQSYNGQTIRVTTQAATSVTNASATLNGFLESLGPYVEVYAGFEYVLNDGTSADALVTTKTALTKLTAPGPFSASVSGLTSYKPYQFRAVAESNVAGEQKALGGYRPFHTLFDEVPKPIVLSNGYVSDITPGTAVIYGYLSSMESYNEVKVWLDWGSSAGFGNTTGGRVLYEPGPFSAKISGLSPSTRYYFRAGALPAIGGIATVYSTTDSFTTPGAGNLTVSTWPETNVTPGSAYITGNLESMGANSSANVWFEWGTTAAYGSVTPMQTMYQPGIYTYRLQGLSEGTTYHFRALAIPGSGGWVTERGQDKEFTTVTLPGIAVSTEQAGRVTATSAELNGRLTSTGPSGTVSAWFEYGTDTTFGSSTQRQIINGPGSFAQSITGLSPGTTYYFRSAASADGRSAGGQYSTFSTTAAATLSISTRLASSITPSSALIHAYINSTGSAPYVRAWFNYGTGPETAMSTSAQTFTSAGAVSAQLSGLIADTTYHFQAAAQSPDGKKVYGEQATFRTASVPKIAVSTVPPTGITDSSATLNGKLDNLGSTASAQAWFEYGTTAAFGNVTIVRTLNSPVPFSSAIPVLPGTTYYYRAKALDPAAGGDQVSGSTISFLTASQPPLPQVSPVTSPYDWFVYLQRFVSVQAEIILKSLKINFGM